ncbi:SpaA isopeptide-forming pilin-related protein [Caniella muris]|uniref:SpaA isopeptide-forming pilin-related protein n=1 Tax=Caniella muris TaxID=2941502 RepID=UPI00203D8D1F|nr:SpaA isopeptide-forming pilin-related protein [Caniella muris]
MFSPKSKIACAARAACVAGLSLSLVGGVCAPAVQALAAEGAGFAITGAVQGESYRVHKLFGGSFTTDAEGKLHMGDITVNAANQAAVIGALKASGVEVEDAKPESMSDVAWANKIAQAVADLPEAKRQSFANKLSGTLYGSAGNADVTVGADGTASVAGLADGYYLICASDANSGDGYVATSGILVPVKDGKVASADGAVDSVAVKKSVPTVSKKVKDNATSEVGDVAWDKDYGKVADTGIKGADGSRVQSVGYEITGTVPSNIADFETFEYKIVDILPDGMAGFGTTTVLEVDTLDVVGVTIEGNDSPTVPAKFVVSEDGKTLTWSVDDLKAALKTLGVADEVMKDVKLVAHTNIQGTAFGNAGYWDNPQSLNNPLVNTAHVEFSYDPYVDGKGTNSSNEDQAKLYSYSLKVNKVGDDAGALSGAKFTLSAATEGSDPVDFGKNVTVGDDGTFTFTGLEADIEYTLTETQVPAGHKAIDPIRFKISATVSAEGDEITAISATETADPSGAATFTVDDATVVATVVNIAGPQMPVTGMAGIAGGILAGGVLIAVSGVKLARAKKDSE